MMKKIFFGIIGFVLLFGITVVVFPVFFKKQVKAFLDKKLSEQLNATVFYDAESFSLSLLKNFPSMSVSIGNVGIVGKAPFENDTLFYAGNFRLDLNLKSLLSKQIQVEAIKIKDLSVYAKVLKEGNVNWDIVKSSDTPSEPSSEKPSQDTLQFKIHQWNIENARIIYEDQSMPLKVTLDKLSHEGNGDFTLDNFDLRTKTEVKAFFFQFGNIEYVSGKKLTADATINMDMPTMKFTFRENKASLNDFAIGFDGYFQLLDEGFQLDIRFASKETSFKSLMSLMPGIYKKEFSGVSATGTFAFDGFVRGLMSEEKKSMPAYAVNLKVNEGNFQYPSLPSRIEKVFMDMAVRNETGKTEDLLVDVPRFTMQIAQNPIDAKARLKGLDAYDVSMKAKMDLGMLQKVYPIDNAQLSGLLDVDFASKGTMKAVEAKDYQNLSTKGEVRLQSFTFSSKDVPQGVKINQAVMTFNPAEIGLSEFVGYFGKSDVQMKGVLQDYMQYAFQNGTLKGKLSFVSQNFDVNEWMTESSTSTPADTSTVEPIVIPKNIDFVLDARIGKVTYTNLVLNDLVGLLTVRNGVVSMNNLQFNTLGGTVRTTGNYDTQNPEQPHFDFELDVAAMSFQESFKTFNTIQKLAPIAQNVTGTYGTKLKIDGLLGKGMTPVLSSLNGMGNLTTHAAALVGVSTLNQISTLSGIQQLRDPAVKDFVARFEIQRGNLYLNPTDIEMAGIKSSIVGKTSLDGSLDYLMKVDLKGLALSNPVLANIENVSFRIGGTYDNPQVKMELGDLFKQKRDELINEAKQNLQETSKEVKENVKESAQELLKDVISGTKTDSTRSQLQEQLQESGKDVKEKAREKIEGIFKRKKGNE